MLDPDQNGKHIDLSGPELLERIPQDVVILDWKYEGRFDTESVFPSLGMFKNAGFTVYGCPWWRTRNVIGIVNSVRQYGADGVLLTSWSGTTLEGIQPEMMQAVALGSYLAWSPERAEPDRITRLPDESFRVAREVIRLTTGLTGPGIPVREASPLLTEAEIARRLGSPQSLGFDFLANRLQTRRGQVIIAFSRTGRPSAVAVTGHPGAKSLRRDSEIAIVRLGEKARGLVFLMRSTINRTMRCSCLSVNGRRDV